MFDLKRAQNGLSAYAKTTKPRPLLSLVNIIEGLLSLMGLTVIILLIMSGSFTGAGLMLDQAASSLVHFFTIDLF